MVQLVCPHTCIIIFRRLPLLRNEWRRRAADSEGRTSPSSGALSTLEFEKPAPPFSGYVRSSSVGGSQLYTKLPMKIVVSSTPGSCPRGRLVWWPRLHLFVALLRIPCKPWSSKARFLDWAKRFFSAAQPCKLSRRRTTGDPVDV